MKVMPKIKVLTTLRNQDHFGGIARSGTVQRVPQDYAKELVEDRGYAEYVDEEFEVVETPQGGFPKKFLQTEIPENFPNEKIWNKLQSNDINTFQALVSHDSYGDIKGIGEKYAEKLAEGVSKALDEWTDAKDQG